MYARTNRCYNKRGSSIRHCIYISDILSQKLEMIRQEIFIILVCYYHSIFLDEVTTTAETPGGYMWRPQWDSSSSWHGYVLHEGITYKSRVPRTSQMTSRLLRHTAVARRAHNVLCNSYNTRSLLCARITCYVTVITVDTNHCSFRRVRFALLYIVTRSKIV
jgi:hypothetical protein